MINKRIGLSCRSVHALLLQLLLLIFVTSIALGFVNSPKIITKDGNLIFESGLNRNISFHINGNSSIILNEKYDLMDLLLFSKRGRNANSSYIGDGLEHDEALVLQAAADLGALQKHIFGPHGLDQRLRYLQNRTIITNRLLRSSQERLRRLDSDMQLVSQRLELDSCKSNPCENGGTCFSIYNGFLCKCNKNFEGLKCEKDVNECALFEGTDLGCQNGGQCVNMFGGYNCICTPGWFGIHCAQRKGDCLQSSPWELCGHGTCVSSNDNYGYKCICDQGWKTNGLTPTCVTDVDECNESHPPCVTKCINLPGSFTCAPCSAGFTGNGINCRDIDECAVENGGCSLNPRVPCINSFGSYHCGECPFGWTGDGRSCVRQSDNNNENNSGDTGVGRNNKCSGTNVCHASARCEEISNTVVCTCPAGMVGTGIGMNGCVHGTAYNCNSRPCLNGGTCIDTSATNYTCLCPIGYRAPNCEPIASPCEPNPCRNNGRCRPGSGTNFECQCAPGYSGRLCDSRFSRCGGMLIGSTGHLKYPEGATYEHHEQCAWVIRTNETKVLNVTFNSFEIEDSTECRFDWLQINDGRTAAAQIIGRFCGSHKPMGGNIISTTNDLYLWFRADGTTAKAGFDLEWNSIPPQCGGIIQIESHGTIATPGSPGNYPKNRDCIWQLRAPNDKRIKLTFFSMEIEDHDSCNYDYVEIKDAISNEILEKYCKTAHPQPVLLPTNEANIHFHSDNEASDTGFQIYYSLESRRPHCGGTFTAKEGIIESPVFAEGSCEYDIKLSTSETIKIEFLYFDMSVMDCVELYDVKVENEIRSLQSKYCGGYGFQPPIFHSLYNNVQIKYYSSIFSKGGQFKLKYKADCSYTFESESGTITSPNYPNLNNVERRCIFKITTEPGTVISMNFIDFDVRDSGLDDEDCSYSYLKMTDGIERTILGPVCGNSTIPHDVVSSYNHITLSFETDVTSYGRGFKIEYKAVPMGKSDCGGVYTKTGYTIRLPTDDNGEYMNEMKCYWIIMAPLGKGILINWKSFDMEFSFDCSVDFVEIYDNLANSEHDKPLGRYCEMPPSFTTYSRILTIKFQSDYSDGGGGFEAIYDFIDTNKCGGEIFASTGKINSPEWPNKYTNEVDCTWIITAPEGTQIELQIDIFELEESENCTHDSLEIRNGGSEHATLVGSYCGKKIPRAIPSFTNQMRVHFHSDSFVNAFGFQILWVLFSNGCGGLLNGQIGVITSPHYPNAYSINAECEWQVQVHPGSSIHITIEDLALEDLYQCSYDYIDFLDSGVSLARMCKIDENTPKYIETTSNQATIRFVSDSSNNERGFLISYYANCTKTITASYGIIESQNYHDEYYRNYVDCKWTIKAPKGNRIAVEFTHFESTADGSAIYFIDITKNGSIQHRVVEGSTFNSTGDTLVLIHNNTHVNFRLEYAMVGCIKVFLHESGQFASPNYPGMYPNNVECTWEIRTDLGKGIELHIASMDIEESVNCTKDALQISHTPYSDHVKERHCGHGSNMTITSSGHRLYVRFFSNEATNGKGFESTYRTVNKTCGGSFKSKNGVIHSPNYPQNYPPSVDCEWTVEVAPSHTITFTIEELDMEGDSDYCAVDQLDLTEIGEYGTEDNLFRLCGQLDPERSVYKTNSNKATVYFSSDESIEGKGFKLSYHENCGGIYAIDDQQSKDIDIKRYSQVNETCQWILIANSRAERIVLVVTHVHLSPIISMSGETEEDCKEKGVKIYEGMGELTTARSKFCREHPLMIISEGRALTITVPLNVINEFHASASIHRDACKFQSFTGITGTFSTPDYPSSYPLNVDCEWHFVASAGNAIVVTFETFDLEDSEGCNNDFVEIRNGTREHGKVLATYCGNTIPTPFTGTNVHLRFHSDNDNVRGGFWASYNYATHNELEGATGTVASPGYPSVFHSNNPYSWRITVDKNFVILITMRDVTDVNAQFIKIYDGYSDIGGQIDYSNTHVVRSNTNIVYITAQRGPFHFTWDQYSKEAVRSNETAAAQSKLCGNQMITVRSQLIFNSLGYPNGYPHNLNCTWTLLPEESSTHAILEFNNIDLEEFPDCFADYVTVSASNDLDNWKQLDKLCKKSPTTAKQYKGTPYLKLNFVTDVSVNKTGFSAYVRTECGSELTDRHAFVNITNLSMGPSFFRMDCVWTIRVRQSRRIRITFPDSYLRDNKTTDCFTYVLVRNGMAEDSPFLGKGKYCENDITDVLETSSNRAYIKFIRVGFPKFRASFHYEELAHECSDEIVLSEDTEMDRMKTITSPNYPNIPNPHSECIWRITAPLHHVIMVEFIGKFDLAPGNSSCDREYVQLNDGATELMPMFGQYCGTGKPNSRVSTGNALLVKYFTDIMEPHSGFMANVSIGRCGGAYYAREGIITSPSNLRFPPNAEEVECVYTIETEIGSTIDLSIEKLEMPYNINCSTGTHLELQEIFTYAETENITDRLILCGDDTNDYIIETNKVVIYYRVQSKRSNDYMFKIHYKTISSRCGETIVASQGTLQTPGYPNGMDRPASCVWNIRVPKGRRIKLEVLDFDTGASSNTTSFSSAMRRLPFRGRITVSNDFAMNSVIKRIWENPPAEVYSTDNTMHIDAFLLAMDKHRGFKLRFSSDEDAQVCGNDFDLNTGGAVQFKVINDTSLYCSYDLKMNDNETLVIRIDKFEKGNSYLPSEYCGLTTPLKLTFHQRTILPSLLCGNESQPAVRLPYPISLEIIGNQRNKLIELDLEYKIYKCGGIWPIFSSSEAVTFTKPNMGNYSGVLECAWAVWPNKPFNVNYLEGLDSAMENGQLELSISTDFKEKCDLEYLLVYNGPNQNSPHLGSYCTQSTASNLILERGLFFEYYTSNYEQASAFNLTVVQGSGCGGQLTYPYRNIIFDYQYKHNAECIWDISTEPGFHLRVEFHNRFFIEDSPGCKKDYVRVEEMNSNDDWVTLGTFCGRNAPGPIDTKGTQMRLIFRSDGDTIGEGFQAMFDRRCGGILRAASEVQTLVSPGYPIKYPNNLFCNYTILASNQANRGILLQFTNFLLESVSTGECVYDNLTIYTWSQDHYEQEAVLCGERTGLEYRGTVGMSLILQTDYAKGTQGFKLEYSTNVCGGLVTNSSIVESPKHHSDGGIPPDSNCFWNITAPVGYKILIKFEILDFESHSECIYDSVEIYKGLLRVEDQRLAKFCGNLTGTMPTISVPTNAALIHSVTDDRDSSRGFKCLVSFIPNCDKHIFLGPQNTTYNFNAFSGKYDNNLDCAYVFKTTPDRQILIDFEQFHLEESDKCADDFLEIRDGAGPFADLIGQFCGHIKPARLTSSRNSMFVRFATDANETSSGFSALISASPLLCGQHNLEVKENESLVLKSPTDSNGKYPKNVNCYWRIKSDKHIHLKFDKLDISVPNANGTCADDYVKIYNADDANMIENGLGTKVVFNGQYIRQDWLNFATEHIYCGNVVPDDLFPATKDLVVKFNTKESGEAKSGFSLTATAVTGCYRNFTGTQGRIFVADTTDHCDIYIKAPQNYSLTLYYADVTFAESDCSVEYIEVFDAHTNTSLQHICSYIETGKSLFTNTNELRMRIKMNGYYTQYDATYLASKNGPGCGGTLYNTAGILTNPFYPNNVRNNSDCRWNIQVPNNVHVLLRFVVFDMGAKSTCQSDFLQIIEQREDGSEQIMRQFCGGDTPGVYKSTRSKVILRFHKTVNYDGTGWVIHFNGVYANYKIPEYMLNG